MSAARRADAGHSAYDWRAEGCAGSMTVTRQNLDAMGHTVNVMCRPWALGTLAPACHLLVACQPSQQVSTTDIATRGDGRHHHQHRGGSGGPCRRRSGGGPGPDGPGGRSAPLQGFGGDITRVASADLLFEPRQAVQRGVGLHV